MSSKYMPFERNRYFYGKLLSVNDFELEQNYNNDKRQLINRYIHGTGVVNGLYVLAIDDDSISVENGLALDYLGREITVPESVIKKLELIDGYNTCIQSQELNYMYLCIDYEEKETDPVQSIVNNISYGNDRNQIQYNKISEGYKLYLTSAEPKDENMFITRYLESINTIYKYKGITIKMITPKYARSGERFPIKIVIENLERSSLSFGFDMQFDGIKFEGKNQLHVSFDERMQEKSDKYEITYMLEAADIKETQANIIINSKSCHIVIYNERQEVYNDEIVIDVNILNDGIVDKVVNEYYYNEMNYIEKSENNTIYLAKIYVNRIAEKCTINKVVNNPFYQYVLNPSLMQMIHSRFGHLYGKYNNNNNSKSGDGKLLEGNINIKNGIVRLPIPSSAEKNSIIYSKEISHGLGIGAVSVIVGFEKNNTDIIYGDETLFEENGVNAKLGVKINQKTGKFVIGAKLLSTTGQQELVIHWTALKDTNEILQESFEKRILIKPSTLELNIRESYNLEVVCENMRDKNVKWYVKDNGGEIDANGLYTAPNMPGVYEITAQSVAFPEVKASIFVLVRK